jgi:spore coat protein U-like protein
MTTRTLLRTLLGAAALAVVAAAAPAAAQVTDTFQVTANVARNCTIVATDVAVGAYDPVVANDTAPATATGTVTVRCTRGTAYSVALDNGANYSGGRRMAGPAGTFLTYELYRDSGYANVWGSGAGNEVTGTQAPGRLPTDLTVYARVPGGQDVPEGAYADTVVATINF